MVPQPAQAVNTGIERTRKHRMTPRKQPNRCIHALNKDKERKLLFLNDSLCHGGSESDIRFLRTWTNQVARTIKRLHSTFIYSWSAIQKKIEYARMKWLLSNQLQSTRGGLKYLGAALYIWSIHKVTALGVDVVTGFFFS